MVRTLSRRTPELVVFDFDGCLVDSIPLAVRAHQESLAAVGISIPTAEIESSIRSSYAETIQALLARHPEYLTALAGGPLAKQVETDNARRLELFAEAPLFPIVPYLLDSLSRCGAKLVIFSSSTRARIDRHLRSHKLGQFFDSAAILASDELDAAHRKPSGTALRSYRAQLHLADSALCLYFGHDSADYAAAADAGLLYLSAEWSPLTQYTKLESPIPVRSLLDLWALGVIPTVHPIAEELSKLLEANRLSLFLGAGFSLDCGFDDWAGLVKSVLGSQESIREGSLPELVAAYVRRNGAMGKMRLLETIEEALTPRGGPRAKHHLLGDFDLERIWTTNFDSLIEDAGDYQVIAEDSELSPPTDRTQLVKIHGSVVSRAADLVFSRREFDLLFREKTEILSELLSDASKFSMLFLGVSFDDPLSKFLLSNLAARRDNRFRVPTHYTLRKFSANDETLVAELLDYGVQTVHLPSWETIEEILLELSWRKRRRNAVISGALLQSEPTTEQIEFMELLGGDLVAAGFNIFVGNGPGVATHVVRGAKAWMDNRVSREAHRRVIKRFNRELRMKDFFEPSGAPVAAAKERIERLILPAGTFVFVEQGEDDPYDPLRREMFADADICLALGGEMPSRGMQFEQDLAIKKGVPYLPLPQLGGFGLAKYETCRLSGFELFHQTGAVPLIRELQDETSPQLASRLATASAILLVTRWNLSST